MFGLSEFTVLAEINSFVPSIGSIQTPDKIVKFVQFLISIRDRVNIFLYRFERDPTYHLPWKGKFP
jgi:hypothetical protein